jgi:hypothetical protein
MKLHVPSGTSRDAQGDHDLENGVPLQCLLSLSLCVVSRVAAALLQRPTLEWLGKGVDSTPQRAVTMLVIRLFQAAGSACLA